jgi:hypothetical protein
MIFLFFLLASYCQHLLAYLTFLIYTAKKHNALHMTLIILPSATWTIKKFPAKLSGASPHTNVPNGGIKEIKPVGP